MGTRCRRPWGQPDFLRLHLAVLARAGLFAAAPGTAWTGRWRCGPERLASIDMAVHRRPRGSWTLDLQYAINGVNVSAAIGVTGSAVTDDPSAGRFRCPLTDCARRVRELFRPGGATYFGCARCHGLVQRAPVRPHRSVWSACEAVICGQALVAAAEDAEQLNLALDALAAARRRLAPLVQREHDRWRQLVAAQARVGHVTPATPLSALLRLVRSLAPLNRELVEDLLEAAGLSPRYEFTLTPKQQPG